MLQSFLPSPNIPRRSSLGRMVNQSTMLLMGCIGTLILMLALLILFHENANATKGYRLRSLERERTALLLGEEILNMQVAEAQAMETLKSDRLVQVMVPVRNAKFTESDSTVAAVTRN